MSAETFTPRSSEIPGYWETIKHFGNRAIRWALGVQEPQAYSASRPRTEQSHLSVAEWQTSPTALTQKEQRAVRAKPVEAPSAPDLSYLMGVEAPTTLEAPGKTMSDEIGDYSVESVRAETAHPTVEGAVVIGGQSTKAPERSVGPPGGIIEAPK